VLSALLITALFTSAIWRLTPKLSRDPALIHVPVESKVVSFSMASMGMVFLQFLGSQTDKILIGFFLNAREVGIYAVAMGMVAFVPSILKAVNQMFAPTIAELHAAGEHAVLARLYQTLTKWILGLTIPLILTIALFSHPLMRIFGRDFEIGASCLTVATLAELIDCGVGSVGFLLLMSGNERRLLRIQIVMAVAILGLNVWLIPTWGILGAAVASAVATVATNLWSLQEVRSRLGLFPYSRSYYRLVVPVTASFAVLWLVRLMPVSIPPVVVMGTALTLSYAVFLGIALLFGLDADDQLIARAAWSRLRQTVTGAR